MPRGSDRRPDAERKQHPDWYVTASTTVNLEPIQKIRRQPVRVRSTATAAARLQSPPERSRRATTRRASSTRRRRGEAGAPADSIRDGALRAPRKPRRSTRRTRRRSRSRLRPRRLFGDGGHGVHDPSGGSGAGALSFQRRHVDRLLDRQRQAARLSPGTGSCSITASKASDNDYNGYDLGCPRGHDQQGQTRRRSRSRHRPRQPSVTPTRRFRPPAAREAAPSASAPARRQPARS